MELCLGTVQFGLDYGIKGQRKPDKEDSISWLDYATQKGICAIDTAKAYGDAESIVGEFLQRKTIARDRLRISSKLLPNILDGVSPDEYVGVIERELKAQLMTLHIDFVDTFVFHSSRYAFDDVKIEAIHQMKEKGFARKIGVSVYEVDEAKACFDNMYVDFIQLPYSIFDHRMKDGGVLDAENKCEIDSRSAFIQGLIVMNEEEVPSYLEKARPIIRRIKGICEEHGVSRVQLAMQYVKREKGISHLVFGVDSLEQLKEDISFFDTDLPDDMLYEVGKMFGGLDADIVMPSLWKKDV